MKPAGTRGQARIKNGYSAYTIARSVQRGRLGSHLHISHFALDVSFGVGRCGWRRGRVVALDFRRRARAPLQLQPWANAWASYRFVKRSPETYLMVMMPSRCLKDNMIAG